MAGVFGSVEAVKEEIIITKTAQLFSWAAVILCPAHVRARIEFLYFRLPQPRGQLHPDRRPRVALLFSAP
jgi:hypothetical protein